MRRASKREKPVLPANNLELDLGLDSVERVELILDLEHALGAKIDDQAAAQIYTVRELVDVLLQARDRGPSTKAAAPGWDVILESKPDDPRALAILEKSGWAVPFWFLLAKLISVFSHIFCSLRVYGREKLPLNGPLILCPNHQSYIDAAIILSQIPWRLFKEVFTVGTSEIFGQGPLAPLANSLKVVPIDPDSNLVNAMRAGAWGLKKGKVLLLYPEGSRTIDGTPKTFKKGAAILSTHLQSPIYPVAIEGLYQAWPRGKRFPRLAKLQVSFGDAIYPPQPHNSLEDAYNKLTEELHARVITMWEELRQGDREAAKMAVHED